MSESIRYEIFIAKREIRQADRKWRNTKLTIFKDLYRQARHKVSKLVHTAKCKFYTKRIALASSNKELHQIVNTLSNRHPPKILPTIYPSADHPSIFIKHFINKVEKLRANIGSKHVTSTLVTGTTAATFSSFEKVSQLTVKECIHNSAPKSCEIDPIPSKLIIECLDSILPSLTDLINSSLASSNNASNQLCHTYFYFYRILPMINPTIISKTCVVDCKAINSSNFYRILSIISKTCVVDCKAINYSNFYRILPMINPTIISKTCVVDSKAINSSNFYCILPMINLTILSKTSGGLQGHNVQQILHKSGKKTDSRNKTFWRQILSSPTPDEVCGY